MHAPISRRPWDDEFGPGKLKVYVSVPCVSVESDLHKTLYILFMQWVFFWQESHSLSWHVAKLTEM